MRRGVSVAIAAVVLLAIASLGNSSPRPAYGLAGESARGHVGERFVEVGGVEKRLPALSGGLMASAQERLAGWADNAVSPAEPTVIALGCGNRTSNGNVRVNQDCTFRRQTDGAIAINPTNPMNVVAAQNDSSIGWNHCGFDYSLDGGQTWGSGVPPFFQRGNHPTPGHTLDGGDGTLHTYDAASDPSMTFDSRGNAFLSCVLFDINDPAAAILVARSPVGASGSYYNTIPPYSGTGTDPATGVVIEDNTVNATPDEPKLAVDSFRSGPHRDHVYITWTEFIARPICTQGGTCSSPIYFAKSTNHGQAWSEPKEVSGNNSAVCSNGNLFDKRRKVHDCDLDEGSAPVVLPNGDIVVAFNNSNTSGKNVNNQILAVVSTNDGSTWSRPVLVGTDIVKGEPQCALGDGNGTGECAPGGFVRTNDDPMAAVDPQNGDVYAVWNDYANGRYCIHLSESTDNGKTWIEHAKSVDPGFADSYMPSIGVSTASHGLVVAYYTSTRVPGQNQHSAPFEQGKAGAGTEPTVFMVATSATATGPWSANAVSPDFGSPNGDQVGYNGDYSGVAVAGATAHVIWSDTRNIYRAGGATLSDEDIFTATTNLP